MAARATGGAKRSIGRILAPRPALAGMAAVPEPWLPDHPLLRCRLPAWRHARNNFLRFRHARDGSRSSATRDRARREKGDMMFLQLAAYLESRLRREEGATMVEYGLMVALIAVVALLAVTALGVNVSGKFQDIATAVAP